MADLQLSYSTQVPMWNSTNSSNVTMGDSASDDEFFYFVLNGLVVPLLFGMITVTGMIGNILVIYVILSRTRMRTVTNLLLLNLAFADLSFVVVIPPSTAYQFATHQWPFGDVVCRLMHYLVNVTAYVTVYTLVLISAIRYMTIVHHVATMRIRTKLNVILMIIGVWITFLLLNTPVLLTYASKEKTTEPGTYDCDHKSPRLAKRLFATFFAFAYALPLLVIAVFSICILHHIQHQRIGMIEKHKRKRSSMKRKQASRLIILVVVIFAILWLPIHIHLLMAFFGSLPETRTYSVISVFWYCAAYFNSCVNPFIYNHASMEFRQAFHEVMCCLPMGRRGSQRPSMSTMTTKLVTTPIEANGKEVLHNHDEEVNCLADENGKQHHCTEEQDLSEEQNKNLIEEQDKNLIEEQEKNLIEDQEKDFCEEQHSKIHIQHNEHLI